MTAKRIFVFGSNLAGIHGAGSAKAALKKHHALMGQGIGRQGASYAIPTKGYNFEVLPLSEIRKHIGDFLVYASEHPHLEFDVVAIGCGLAGYKPEEIAPMFKDAPSNCHLPKEFLSASSVGSFFHSNIRNSFDVEKQ